MLIHAPCTQEQHAAIWDTCEAPVGRRLMRVASPVGY
jgi:hypothetical protein